MRKQDGFICISGPMGEEKFKCFTCQHCSRIVRVPIGAKTDDVGGGCYHCWGLICPACTAKGTCDPFLEKLKRAEQRGEVLRSYGL